MCVAACHRRRAAFLLSTFPLCGEDTFAVSVHRWVDIRVLPPFASGATVSVCRRFGVRRTLADSAFALFE